MTKLVYFCISGSFLVGYCVLWHTPMIVGVGRLYMYMFDHFIIFWFCKMHPFYYIFPALGLESAILPRSPGFFYWDMVLETKLWVLCGWLTLENLDSIYRQWELLVLFTVSDYSLPASEMLVFYFYPQSLYFSFYISFKGFYLFS